MSMSLTIGPIAALIAGILILIVPRLLNYIIALYLIITGAVGLFGAPQSGKSASIDNVPPTSIQKTAPARVGPTIDI